MRKLLPALVDRAVMRPERLVDSWFDELFEDPFFAPEVSQAHVFTPKADISENEDAYTVRLEIPGIEAKDVSVEYLGDVLTVKGEKRHEHEEEDGASRWYESSYGSFRRAFRLEKPVDAGKVEAKLRSGVLTITLPKTEDAKPRRIEVKLADAPIGATPELKAASKDA